MTDGIQPCNDGVSGSATTRTNRVDGIHPMREDRDMKNAVAELIGMLPGATFDNTGGGCMVIAMPVRSAHGSNGAVVITGTYGGGQGDNFSRGADRANYVDADLIGFDAWFHSEWYGDLYDSADGRQVYVSPDFDALAGIAWDSPEYPEDEDAYRLDANARQAGSEVVKCASAVLAFVAGLGE